MEQKLKQDHPVGKNIRNFRIRLKLTQEQVVAKMQLAGCTLTRSSYAKIETGQCNIRISELKALKDIYQVSWDDIFQNI